MIRITRVADRNAPNPNGKNAKEYRGIIGSFISGGFSRNANSHTGSAKERETIELLPNRRCRLPKKYSLV